MEIEKMFETKINPETVRSRVRGAIKKSGLINPPTETLTVSKNTEVKLVGHGGKRKEAGRHVKNLSQKEA